MTTGAIQAITWLSAAVFLMGFVIYLRHRFQVQAIKNILVEYITPSGHGYTQLVPEQGGSITVPPAQKGGKGRVFPLAETSTYQIAFPENYPRLFQTKIKKIAVRTDTLEPISNLTGIPTMEPEMFYDLMDEQAMSVAIAASRDIKELSERLEKQPKPSTLYIWLAIITVITLGCGFYMYNNLTGIQEGIDILRAGAGV